METWEVEQQSAQWMAVNHVSHTLMLDIFIFDSSPQKIVFVCLFIFFIHHSFLSCFSFFFFDEQQLIKPKASGWEVRKTDHMPEVST